MGFQRVCTVKNLYGQWFYEQIDRKVMYKDHSSWVYCITMDGYIEKVGESGQPLGIITNNSASYQPKKGSESRLGRYINGDSTDKRIRDELREDIDAGRKVEIWALECPETIVPVDVMDTTFNLAAHIHKQLEKLILDMIKLETGFYPRLNSGRA